MCVFRAQAIQKRLFMEKVASRQQEREEAFKASVEQKHSSKAEQQRATEKARAREAEARQYERMAQQYEARERVLGALKGRQRHLEALEARWAEKDQRTDTLLREREKAALSRRSLFGMLARERQVSKSPSCPHTLPAAHACPDCFAPLRPTVLHSPLFCVIVHHLRTRAPAGGAERDAGVQSDEALHVAFAHPQQHLRPDAEDGPG